jgi:hypothetical protein
MQKNSVLSIKIENNNPVELNRLAIVDVEVCYIEDVPKSYKILKLYKNDVFDPND